MPNSTYSSRAVSISSWYTRAGSLRCVVPPLDTVAVASYPSRFTFRSPGCPYACQRPGAGVGTGKPLVAPSGMVPGAWVSAAASGAGTTDQCTLAAKAAGVTVASSVICCSPARGVNDPPSFDPLAVMIATETLGAASRKYTAKLSGPVNGPQEASIESAPANRVVHVVQALTGGGVITILCTLVSVGSKAYKS